MGRAMAHPNTVPPPLTSHVPCSFAVFLSILIFTSFLSVILLFNYFVACIKIKLKYYIFAFFLH
jgi:hypothetical protein